MGREPPKAPWKGVQATLAGPRKSLLIGLFGAFRWRIVFALARPVTPEVAGSSPVAPALYTPSSRREDGGHHRRRCARRSQRLDRASELRGWASAQVTKR